ncbi:MAG: calcium-binding protein [Tateyamaria sp.]|uniref:calcium-binding protein n=1 Tax=Tateyamaria sp. TaxID=1929288 RepID=UPI003271C2E3
MARAIRDLIDLTILRDTFFDPFAPISTFTPTLEVEQVVGETRNFLFLGNNESLFLNDGIVRDFVSGRGDSDVLIANTGIIGESDRNDTSIFVTGTGDRAVLNAGDILGGIQLGGGDDLVFNTNLIDDDVRTGSGDDILFNTGVIDGDVWTGAGDDLIENSGFQSAAITGHLNTGAGDDVVENTGDIDRVSLGNGDDLFLGFNGGGTVGQISAGTGNDTVRGHASNDVVFGGNGRDLIQGIGGDDSLFGGNGADLLQGANGEDLLVGGQGSDTLLGGRDTDELQGGNGTDRLVGGRGDDVLSGGSGADTFIFGAQSGDDTITDFNDGDVITIYNVGRGDSETGLIVRFFTYETIEEFTTYENGNAFIDLVGAANASEIEPVFSYGANHSILLLDIEPDSLTENDFDLGY